MKHTQYKEPGTNGISRVNIRNDKTIENDQALKNIIIFVSINQEPWVTTQRINNPGTFPLLVQELTMYFIIT